jgi:hypothetical protein
MSVCKHRLVWHCGYYCGICGKSTLEICEEYDAEIARLTEWKRSALEVESSWDCQAVAKAIGVPLGGDIRKHILPYLLEKQKENAALRERVERLAEIETALSLFRATVDRLAKENETLRSQLAVAEERETP